MQRIYSVTFVLRDGTKYDTVEKAKDHCRKKMLAVLRPFVEQFAVTRGQYLKCVEAVEDSTYDEVFSEYLERHRPELSTHFVGCQHSTPAVLPSRRPTVHRASPGECRYFLFLR